MIEVLKNVFVKTEELESGAKLISAYNKNGKALLKKGRFCFYDTKHKSVY